MFILCVARTLDVLMRSIGVNKQTLYVQRNVERVLVTVVEVEKYCFTYSESVFALGIQHAKRMRRIVVCDLPGSKIFSHINS